MLAILVQNTGAAVTLNLELPNQVVTKNKETMTIDGVKIELFEYTAKSAQFTGGDRIADWTAALIEAAGDHTIGRLGRPRM